MFLNHLWVVFESFWHLVESPKNRMRIYSTQMPSNVTDNSWDFFQNSLRTQLHTRNKRQKVEISHGWKHRSNWGWLSCKRVMERRQESFHSNSEMLSRGRSKARASISRRNWRKVDFSLCQRRPSKDERSHFSAEHSDGIEIPAGEMV